MTASAAAEALLRQASARAAALAAVQARAVAVEKRVAVKAARRDLNLPRRDLIEREEAEAGVAAQEGAGALERTVV